MPELLWFYRTAVNSQSGVKTPAGGVVTGRTVNMIMMI